MDINSIINIVTYFILVLLLGYYFATTAQWYSYKLNRVIFHHTKPWWNVAYFLLPFGAYEALSLANLKAYQPIVVLLYAVALFFWYKKLDKPLVFTGRIKRFFAALVLFVLITLVATKTTLLIIPIALAWLASLGFEKILFNSYKIKAQEKLDNMPNLIVVGVTASYGKTSMKNFIAKVLSKKYNIYATPRSVNTLGGIIKDINEDLPQDTEVYVVEMGARERHDIYDIATLVNPHYAIVGTIGPAHIEYFKSLENIRDTKMEILKSNRLKEAWVHISTNAKSNNDKIHLFGHDIKDISSTLDGISFSLDGHRYSANILGSFNAINLAAAIKVAQALGLEQNEIQEALNSIEPVAHRLQKIEAGGKLIIDDSFNGNIDGMLEAFELASTYSGRKVVITPGLVEVDDKLNIEVAKKANEVFDIVVVTGELNYEIFKEYVDNNKLIHLKDKSNFEEFLANTTRSGDLILFANDAPSFI
jgi:UDP-N-acetylmuramoyl-tripeptide--D-alanyl-D-alanine ligase